MLAPKSFFLWLFLVGPAVAQAGFLDELKHLQLAYPHTLLRVSEQQLIWMDGSSMPVRKGKSTKTTQEKLETPDLFDQIHNVAYFPGFPADLAFFSPRSDPGRIRYEPFFKKMYGASQAEVEAKLTVIFWLPKCFGFRYPLLVTTVNGVAEKLQQISIELEVLCFKHPEYLPFLENPGGTYQWRVIANTQRLSPHSFGMSLDINSSLSNYWQWDLVKEGRPVHEYADFPYHNRIPWELVLVFEKYGFIWGGKWRHYDTMHFEYRPELL